MIFGAIAGFAVVEFAVPLPDVQATALASKPVPTAACAERIYSGSSPSAVVHTRHDVVVGPVRFSDLDPRLLGQIPGSSLLGIKSPLTVGPTENPSLLVTAKGAKGFVSITYGQAPSSTTPVELRADADRVVVQAPVSCGFRAAGFVQYLGGFALARKQCVTLTVSVPGGRVLARKTVPLGPGECAPNP